jgi:hypothetical protein
MPTRFYFGQVITSPALAFSGVWSAPGSTPTRLRAHLAKRKAASSTSPLVLTASETTAAILNKLHIQLIARLGSAQTITGTVKGYALFSESDTAQDCRVQCIFRVIAEDGTVRGTLLADDAGALSSEFVTTATNRRIPLLAATNTLTSVNALAGDYLVMEIGHRTHVASGTSYNATITIHDDPATGDLPEDETTTTATLAPWIEFSQTLDLSDSLDSLQLDPPTSYSLRADVSSLPKDNNTTIDATLVELLTPSYSYSLLAGDYSGNRQSVSDLLPTPFDDNSRVTQFPTTTQSTGNLSFIPSDTLATDQTLMVITQLNTPALSRSLIDPTNRGPDLSSFGGVGTIYYTNRVYDSIAGRFVRWLTTSPDSIGASYPGPGVFGVTTTNYVVERRSVL